VAGIERIRWGSVGPYRLDQASGWLFALWPEPINHDACFKAAGVEQFGDPDPLWDSDLQSLNERVVSTLSGHGDPRVVSGDQPVKASFLARLLERERRALDPSEHLALVMHDDQFRPCRVDFGPTPRDAALASDGHAIVWIWLHESVAETWQQVLQELAAYRDVGPKTLKWDCLLPESLWLSPAP